MLSRSSLKNPLFIKKEEKIMLKYNKKSTSVANNLLGCYECNSFKEAKENLIDVLDELEAFGMFNVYCLKKLSPHVLSTEIVQPKVIKEFGYDVPTFGLGVNFLKMIEMLSFEALRIRVLKEAGHFLTESYLIRTCSSANAYPKHYYSEKIKTFGSDQEIEIVFFAESEQGAERIRQRLYSTMVDVKSIQYYVNNMLEIKFNDFAGRLLSDPNLNVITDMCLTMTNAYVEAKQNECSKKESVFNDEDHARKKKGGHHE